MTDDERETDIRERDRLRLASTMSRDKADVLFLLTRLTEYRVAWRTVNEPVRRCEYSEPCSCAEHSRIAVARRLLDGVQ